jgi:hypothetical protein
MPRVYRSKRASGHLYTMPGREVLPRATLAVEPFLSAKGLVASLVHVGFEDRRKGYGTRLYEKAANDACDQGLRLMSSTERSVFSEAFWRKQRRKGRAVCLKRNVDRQDNYNRYSLLDLTEALAQKYRDPLYGTPDYDRAEREMKLIRKRLPAPHKTHDDVAHWSYWPCWRWALKKKLCRQRPISLGGLR